MSDGKRRLPVLDSRRPGGSPEPAGEHRPSWQWIGIGVGLMFLLWMPLAYLAQIASRAHWASRLGETDPAEMAAAYERLEGGARLELQVMLGAVPAVAFLIAALLGGMVLGRLDEIGGLRDATIAGGLVALGAATLAAVTSIGVGSTLGWLLATIVTCLVGAAAARLGAWLGRPKGVDT